MSPARPRIAYLFSRYPIISQTFCDNEILGLEDAGWDLVIGSLNPPQEDFRHRRLDTLRAPVIYSPPSAVLRELEANATADKSWPQELIDDHARRLGESTRPELRCRNALGVAQAFRRLGVEHVHLHFANRAAHSAIFLTHLTGIPFSFTPQAQDFLIDIEPELLAEICREAAFVIAPCDYAKAKLGEMCPDSADKMFRVYNGIPPASYPESKPAPSEQRVRVVSCGRLIEFKGFQHLIAASALAAKQSVRV
ncbi:MAG: glycosyltransferase, partial [Verrucomicrobiota bacterium]